MTDTISFDDFKKTDIRIGKVTFAERVPDSDKLIRLVFDFGEFERQIIAGIKAAVDDPAELVGKEMPVVVNLEPKILRGLESQGMILAVAQKTSGQDKDGMPVLLHPAREVPQGSPVK